MIGHINKGSRVIETSDGILSRLDRKVGVFYDGFYEFAEVSVPSQVRILQPVNKVTYHTYLESLSLDTWAESIGGIRDKELKEFRDITVEVLSKGYIQFDSKLFRLIAACIRNQFGNSVVSPTSAVKLYWKCMNVLTQETSKEKANQVWLSNIEGALQDTRTLMLAKYLRTNLIKSIGNQRAEESQEFLSQLYKAWTVSLPNEESLEKRAPFQIFLHQKFTEGVHTSEQLHEKVCTALFASGQRKRLSVFEALVTNRDRCVSHKALVSLSTTETVEISIEVLQDTLLRNTLLSEWKPRLHILYGNVTTYKSSTPHCRTKGISSDNSDKDSKNTPAEHAELLSLLAENK